MVIDVRIYATLVWYYTICPREVWLMANHIQPDQDNENIMIGRIIHESSYERETKDVEIEGMKFDLVKGKAGNLLVGEIKKSSRAAESSRLQLAFYLYRLRQTGVEAKGVLMFPTERKRIEVILDDELVETLKDIMTNIGGILDSGSPPHAVRNKYCRSCGYNELCWA
jgi:CRISPR-associated exonuclease Cas4